MGERIAGNYYDKYHSRNPLVQFVVRRYLDTLAELTAPLRPQRVLELGCGEGEIIRFLKERHPAASFTGYDAADARKAFRDFSFEIRDLEQLEETASYDLVLCLEVLEHVLDYANVLTRISRIPARAIIISVPNEPFFRLANLLRFAYVSRLGNTPGHVHQFTYGRFRQMIQSHFPGRHVQVRPCLIWSLACITTPS